MTGDATGQSFSRREALRLLNLTERQLRSWEKQNLIAPVASYGFVDLLALRTIVRLRNSRISPATLRLAVAALRRKLLDVGNPLVELRLFTDGKKIRVQVGRQTMEPLTGQLLLDFGENELKRLVSFPPEPQRPLAAARVERESAAELFQRALEQEKVGDGEEAVRTYLRVVEIDPQFAGAWVNLGTIHFGAREFDKARQCYKNAVEADPRYPLARFNLGNLYDELGQRAEALAQYQAALKLQPEYADAHYNIALLYQSSGQLLRAVRHWKAYLKLDPGSPWAHVARRELKKLYRETIVDGAESKL
ncbi:MAG: tetratricopeptide repeat protein [Bryobacteraceae bacterium]|nr:tetratricopeptide repeat protein [Bryobacteraceae bacterium]